MLLNPGNVVITKLSPIENALGEKFCPAASATVLLADWFMASNRQIQPAALAAKSMDIIKRTIKQKQHRHNQATF